MYYSVGSLTCLLESEARRWPLLFVLFVHLVFVSSLSFLVVRRPCLSLAFLVDSVG